MDLARVTKGGIEGLRWHVSPRAVLRDCDGTCHQGRY